MESSFRPILSAAVRVLGHHDSSTSDSSTSDVLPIQNLGTGASATTRSERWRQFAFDVQGRAPPEGLYHRLLQQARERETTKATKQIDLDLHRTFGSMKGLHVPRQEALLSLRNVLLAYAEHNPQVAYCQSMNFLAAVLLLVVDEESAFWILAAIVERLLPGYFSSDMAMILVDQGVLAEFLKTEVCPYVRSSRNHSALSLCLLACPSPLSCPSSVPCRRCEMTIPAIPVRP